VDSHGWQRNSAESAAESSKSGIGSRRAQKSDFSAFSTVFAADSRPGAPVQPAPGVIHKPRPPGGEDSHGWQRNSAESAAETSKSLKNTIPVNKKNKKQNIIWDCLLEGRPCNLIPPRFDW
jgi:hypothetical protein